MQILENISLEKYTTFKMGGIVQTFFFPENVDELMALSKRLTPPIRYIGGGSNILANDEKVFREVVCLRDFNTEIKNLGNGLFRIGASVRLQRLIKEINENGYGGIEYLYSVPGLVGGAVVMNAGRGKKYNQTISDYILEVQIIQEGKIVSIPKDACEFKHRSSIFKNGNVVIVSVLFKFPEGNREQFNIDRQRRIELCREKQDMSFPNYGTVFCVANRKIIELYSRFFSSDKKKICFSRKTNNWMLNKGGTFDDAIKEIEHVKLIHKLLFQKCKEEVIIWK